jgi:hypothetical protein
MAAAFWKTTEYTEYTEENRFFSVYSVYSVVHLCRGIARRMVQVGL